MNIKFIDANCMVGRWGIQKLYFETIGQLLSEMDYHGIEKGLVYHSLAWQYDPEFGNKKLLEEIGGNFRILPIFVIAPWDRPEDEWLRAQEEFVRKNAFAIRLFPRDQNFLLARWNIEKILLFLERIRMPLFINYDQLDFSKINEVLSSYPDLPVIISNTGYRIGRILNSLFERYNNFYLEISTFFSYEGIEEICRRFGAQRLIFGTRMPFIDPGAMLARIIYADIDDEKKRER